MLESFYFVMDVVAFVCCLFTYRSLDRNFKALLPVLSFILVYDFVNIFNWLNLHQSNAWCNNIEDIILFAFFTKFIQSFDERLKRRKRIYIAAGVVILLSIADILLIQGVFKRATIATVIQDLFLIWMICNYYYRLLNNDSDEYIELITHPPFLALTGIFFYYLSTTFFYACFSYMVYRNNYHFYLIAATLLNLTTFALNFLFSLAFICFFRKNRLSSL
ncbi:hypothetical protein SAMN05192574_102627 [Mucilaginibacter gossypiicola]|uniref:Uncharacterized protein n=1 Tax=Mucilaginibacter gossypiicola TaxID=551995 RepID=A0A1H8E966_9SPHI|nr:hypothetical protein [Mucilaginibacter gossypiicola]SEN15946.1 hypothetical protein SAMN05192574_102627 [Mucilaginibacter gossypiicola]